MLGNLELQASFSIPHTSVFGSDHTVRWLYGLVTVQPKAEIQPCKPIAIVEGRHSAEDLAVSVRSLASWLLVLLIHFFFIPIISSMGLKVLFSIKVNFTSILIFPHRLDTSEASYNGLIETRLHGNITEGQFWPLIAISQCPNKHLYGCTLDIYV